MKWRAKPKPLPLGVDADWAFFGHRPQRRPPRGRQAVGEQGTPVRIGLD